MPTTDRLRLELLESRDTPAVVFRVDYSLDATGFFTDPSRRAAVQAAVDALTPLLQDNLSAIIPSGTDTWNVQYLNPSNGLPVNFLNQVIPANEVPLYFIGAPIGGGELGKADTGVVSAVGSASWLQTVRGRGQTGASATPATDFAPWGGFIKIDSSANWSVSSSAPASSQFDFISVAEHEIIHLLGFTTGNPSYSRHVLGGRFIGANVVAAAGGSVPVTADGHWAAGTAAGGSIATMVPAILNGEMHRITTLEQAALKDIGWQSSATSPTSPPATPPTSSPPTSPTSPPATTPTTTTVTPMVPLPPAATPMKFPVSFAVGTSAGRGDARVFNSDQTERFAVQPFGNSFSGGVRVAMGDVDADGVADLIVGTGPGVSTKVIVYSGFTRAVLFSIDPFESSFTGGVYVATGDLDGDGRSDIVITPDEGGGPRVRAFRGGDFAPIADFLGIEDPNFRGGARAAVDDLNGDRIGDLIVAAGFGGGPRIAAFDGASLTKPNRIKIFADFLAFEDSLRNGAFVAAGDIDGDGYADVIAGGGPGGGPRVSAFNGKILTQRNTRDRFIDFLAGSESDRSGIRVAAKDLDDDGKDELFAGGTGVVAYAGKTLKTGETPPTSFTVDAYPGFTGGVFVG